MTETAFDRVSAWVEKWIEDHSRNQEGVDPYHVSGLDVRDLQLLLAVAASASGNILEFSKRADQTVEAWREANANQRDTISRLMAERSRIVGVLYDQSETPTARVGQIKIILGS